MVIVDITISISVTGWVATQTPTRGYSAANTLWTPVPPQTTGSTLQLRGLTDLGLILLRRLYNGLNHYVRPDPPLPGPVVKGVRRGTAFYHFYLYSKSTKVNVCATEVAENDYLTD